MTIAKREKDRARWKRNKRAERARKAASPPREPPDDMIAAIMAERDKRSADRSPWRHWVWSYEDKAMAFIADVWAAKTILEWQHGSIRVTPAKIVRRLPDLANKYGYTAASLRVMIYRALHRIDLMEGKVPTPHWKWGGWEPFDLSSWKSDDAG